MVSLLDRAETGTIAVALGLAMSVQRGRPMNRFAGKPRNIRRG
jgi:hypothetical protein